MSSEHRFIAFDGAPIFYRRFLPDAQPAQAAVLILHGMGEHGGRYTPLAEHLRVKGFEVIVPDLRGFGQSGGRRGHVNRFSDYHRDVLALQGLLTQNGKKDAYFLAHSFGGLIAASYLALSNHPKVDGLILSSPLFGVALPVPAWRKALAYAASFFAPVYAQKNPIVAETLTHDVRMIEAYKTDPLIDHNVSARLYTELLFMLRKKDEIAEKLIQPLLVLQAGEDLVVSKEDSLNFYNKAASKDKKSHIYEAFYHEILNEIGRQQVFDEISNWLLYHSK